FENIAQGNYLMMVSQVGFQKTYSAVFSVSDNDQPFNLPGIMLDEKSTNLKEVNINVTKPFIEHHLDKTVVNVENSIVNAGGTALEILKCSPGITVDNSGNISL